MATKERANLDFVSVLAASNSQPSIPGNQALISALSACNVQPSTTALVVRSPAPHADAAVSVADNPPDQATIATLAQAYPETNVKLQSIVKR